MPKKIFRLLSLKKKTMKDEFPDWMDLPNFSLEVHCQSRWDLLKMGTVAQTRIKHRFLLALIASKKAFQ